MKTARTITHFANGMFWLALTGAAVVAQPALMLGSMTIGAIGLSLTCAWVSDAGR